MYFLRLLTDIIYLKFWPVGEDQYSRIGRLGDPSIGFEKNISAAEKTFKTVAFLGYFGKDLKRESLKECSKIIRVQFSLVFVLLLPFVCKIFARF